MFFFNKLIFVIIMLLVRVLAKLVLELTQSRYHAMSVREFKTVSFCKVHDWINQKRITSQVK